MADSEFAPVTPGEMLNIREEFLAEYGLTHTQLATAIGVAPNRISEIANDRRPITADAALRLGLYFGKQSRVLDEPSNPLRSEGRSQSACTRGRRAHKVSTGGLTGALDAVLTVRLRQSFANCLMIVHRTHTAPVSPC